MKPWTAVYIGGEKFEMGGWAVYTGVRDDSNGDWIERDTLSVTNDNGSPEVIEVGHMTERMAKQMAKRMRGFK